MAWQLVRSTAIIKLICKMPQNAIAQIGLKSSPSCDGTAVTGSEVGRWVGAFDYQEGRPQSKDPAVRLQLPRLEYCHNDPLTEAVVASKLAIVVCK